MNPIPVAVGIAVVAAVPPLRHRAIAAVGASIRGTGTFTVAVLGGALGVAEATLEGALGVADALVNGPTPVPAPVPARPVVVRD